MMPQGGAAISPDYFTVSFLRLRFTFGQYKHDALANLFSTHWDLLTRLRAVLVWCGHVVLTVERR